MDYIGDYYRDIQGDTRSLDSGSYGSKQQWCGASEGGASRGSKVDRGSTHRNDTPKRVHVGIWYTLRAQWGSHVPTLRPKYLP